MARRGTVLLGVSIAVVGVVAGGALAVAAAAVEAQTVEGFARAPVGCTTTLQFDTADTFTFFVETKGSTNDLGGDCAGSGASYSRVEATAPQVELALVNSDDAPVALGAANDFEYDTGDFVGTSFATVEIVAAGTYRLTVTSEDRDFAIAVGRDPAVDSAISLAAGLTIGGLGLLIGAILIVVGAVSAPRTIAATATPPPIAPPGAPFGGYVPTPPPPPPAPPEQRLPPGTPLPPPRPPQA